MNLESRLKADLVTECKLSSAPTPAGMRTAMRLGSSTSRSSFPVIPHLLAEGKIVEHQKFAPKAPRQYDECKRYTAAGGL